MDGVILNHDAKTTFSPNVILPPPPGQKQVSLPEGGAYLSADYSRDGFDLMIDAGPGHAVLIPDYFLRLSPPDLLTAEGAVLNSGLVRSLAGPMAPNMSAQIAIDGIGGASQTDAALGEPIGQVSEAEGTITVTHPDGSQSQLGTGDSIYQGDVLETGAASAISIIFADDTVFSLEEDARMVMDEMVYDPGTQTGTFNAQVVQGVFSFVSGHVAKTSPDGMVINTPTSTIGIRGSTALVQAGAEGEETKIILVRDVDGNIGEIIVQNPSGDTMVLNTEGASLSFFSGSQAFPPPKTLTGAEIQKDFGGSLTRVVKTVAKKAEQDAKQATQKAEQAQQKADQAKKDADQAKKDAEEAKKDAEEAEAKAIAEGDGAALAAAQQAKADAEQAAIDAQTKADAAEKAAGEAEAAQAAAQQANTFNSLASAALTVQVQMQTQAQQAETAGTANTVTGNNTGGGDNNNGDGDNNTGGDGDNGNGDNTETTTTDPVIIVDPNTGNTIEVVEIVKVTPTTDDANKNNTNTDDNTQTNTSPTAGGDLSGVVTTNSSLVLTSADLNATDQETADTSLEYTLSTAPTNGNLELDINGSWTVLHDGETFTQGDVNDGHVRYVNTNSKNSLSDQFHFTVSDDNGGTTTSQTFNLTLNPPPYASGLLSKTVSQNASFLFTTTEISAQDTGTDNADLVITLIGLPANGTLELSDGGAHPSWTTLTIGSTFKQSDINAGLLRYAHNGANAAPDSFSFIITDGDGVSTTTQTFNLTVDALPTAGGSLSDTLLSGGNIVFQTSHLSATDPETTDTALIYRLNATPANGSVQLSDGGSMPVWTTLVNGSTFTQANVDAGLVRYVHNGANTTPDSFSFTVTDGNGGTSATSTFNLSINATPVAGGTLSDTLITGGSIVFQTSHLNATDVETADASLTYTIGSVPTQGQLILDNGSSTTTLTSGSTFTQADVNNGNLAYVHAGSGTTPDSFTFTLTDGHGAVSTSSSFNLTVNSLPSYHTVTSGQVLTITGNTTATTIVNEGVINATSGTITSPSTLTNKSGGILNVTGATLSTANITNEAGGVITYSSAGALGGTVTNYGTIYATTGAHQIAALANYGTIDIASGVTLIGAYNNVPTMPAGSILQGNGTFKTAVQAPYTYYGTVNPGTDGTIGSFSFNTWDANFSRTVNFASSTVYNVDVAALTVDGRILSNDMLSLVTAHPSTLAGTLNFKAAINPDNSSAYTPMAGDTFTVMTYTTGTTGTFTINHTLGAGWNVVGTYGTNSLQLTVVQNGSSVTGSAGNDVFTLAGAQTGLSIIGNGGTDSLKMSGISTDSNSLTLTDISNIMGSDGNDTVTFGSAINNITVDLGLGDDTVNLANTNNIQTFQNVEHIVGGSLNDNISSSTAWAASDNATVDGGGGTDSLTLSGGGANTVTVSNVESITGGTNDDAVTLATAVTSAAINLGGGTDSLTLADGDNIASVTDVETITGGTGNDYITYSGSGTVTVDLGAGTDSFNPYNATVTLHLTGVEAIPGGGPGADTITLANSQNGLSVRMGGGAVTDTLNLADGGNTISVWEDIEIINGGSGNDNITAESEFFADISQFGGSRTRTYDLGAGTDSVTMLGTNDGLAIKNVENVDGGGGADQVAMLTAGTTNFLSVETIIGSAGDDTIVIGDASHPTITGGAGADTLTGNAFGSETYVYTTATDSSLTTLDHITNFQAGGANDKIDINIVGTLNVIANQSTGNTFAALDYTSLNALANSTNGTLATSFTGGGTNTQVMQLTTTDSKVIWAIDVDGSGVMDASDVVIDVTGLSGTLNAADFV